MTFVYKFEMNGCILNSLLISQNYRVFDVLHNAPFGRSVVKMQISKNMDFPPQTLDITSVARSEEVLFLLK